MQVAQVGPPKRGFWLVLDPAQALDDVLPRLREALLDLKKAGVIDVIELTPRRRTPKAVPAVFVTGEAGAYRALSHLPGVLDAVDDLPPAPPEAGVGALWATGTISGRVTDVDSSAPISGANVYVYDAISFAYIDDVLTNSGGWYQIDVTAPYSRAKVYAGVGSGSYAPEWYNDKKYFSEADVVTLTPGVPKTGIDLALAPAGWVRVTVQSANGVTLPANVEAVLYDLAFGVVNGCRLDAAGQCAISAPPGVYKVCFSWGAWPGIVTEWYSDTTSFDLATSITVESKVTTEVMAKVAVAGGIKGIVADESNGAGLGNVWVGFYDSGNNYAGATWTHSWGVVGEYRSMALAPGRYKVRFDPKESPLYVSEWYSNAATMAAAEWVTVTAGQAISVNAALAQVAEKGIVTGALTHSGGNLFNGKSVYVTFYDAGTHDFRFRYGFWGNGATRVYSVSMPAGEYYVHFYSWRYVAEWYSDTVRQSGAAMVANGVTPQGGTVVPEIPSGATVVVVKDGQVTPDISADLAPVPQETGCISGVVTSNGVLLVNRRVYVQAYQVTDQSRGSWYYRRDTDTDANGQYQICDLVSGTYQVSFSAFPSATTWYNGFSWSAGASIVTVTNNVTTTHVDGALDDLGACFSGKVVDTAGHPVPGAQVFVYETAQPGVPLYTWYGRWGKSFYSRGTADKDGGFVICGLSGGTPGASYIVRAIMSDMSGFSDPATATFGEDTDLGDLVIGYKAYLPVVAKP